MAKKKTLKAPTVPTKPREPIAPIMPTRRLADFTVETINLYDPDGFILYDHERGFDFGHPIEEIKSISVRSEYDSYNGTVYLEVVLDKPRELSDEEFKSAMRTYERQLKKYEADYQKYEEALAKYEEAYADFLVKKRAYLEQELAKLSEEIA